MVGREVQVSQSLAIEVEKVMSWALNAASVVSHGYETRLLISVGLKRVRTGRNTVAMNCSRIRRPFHSFWSRSPSPIRGYHASFVEFILYSVELRSIVGRRSNKPLCLALAITPHGQLGVGQSVDLGRCNWIGLPCLRRWIVLNSTYGNAL
jgi:hypothetical protein